MSAYWIALYREVRDPAKLAAYAALAGPALERFGAEFLARGSASLAYEDGKLERTVLIRFPSIGAARSAHESEAYQAALEALGDGAIRDLRIIEALR